MLFDTDKLDLNTYATNNLLIKNKSSGQNHDTDKLRAM